MSKNHVAWAEAYASAHNGRHHYRRADRAYDFIRAYIAEFGIGPTLREIARGIGTSSTSVAAHHVAKLAAADKIAYEKGIPRSITLPGPSRDDRIRWAAKNVTASASYPPEHPGFVLVTTECMRELAEALAASH